MAKSKTYTLAFRRKRKGKTNYRTRLKLLKSNKIRLIIRKSIKNIIIQSAEYHPDGDKIIDTVKSTDLKKYGWSAPTGNIPASYLTGLLFAKKSKAKEGIIDIGLSSMTKGSRLAAVVKGLADGGIKINHSKNILPSEDKIKGLHAKSKDIEKISEEVKSKITK